MLKVTVVILQPVMAGDLLPALIQCEVEDESLFSATGSQREALRGLSSSLPYLTCTTADGAFAHRLCSRTFLPYIIIFKEVVHAKMKIQ